jgi:hypothetical protein
MCCVLVNSGIETMADVSCDRPRCTSRQSTNLDLAIVFQSYFLTIVLSQELANAQIALSNALNLNTTNTTDIHVLLQTNSKSKQTAKQHRRVSRIRTAKARQRGLQLLARRAEDLLKIAKERLVALTLELHGNQSKQQSRLADKVLTTQQQVQWSESAQRALNKAQTALNQASQVGLSFFGLS